VLTAKHHINKTKNLIGFFYKAWLWVFVLILGCDIANARNNITCFSSAAGYTLLYPTNNVEAEEYPLSNIKDKVWQSGAIDGQEDENQTGFSIGRVYYTLDNVHQAPSDEKLVGMQKYDLFDPVRAQLDGQTWVYMPAFTVYEIIDRNPYDPFQDAANLTAMVLLPEIKFVRLKSFRRLFKTKAANAGEAVAGADGLGQIVAKSIDDLPEKVKNLVSNFENEATKAKFISDYFEEGAEAFRKAVGEDLGLVESWKTIKYCGDDELAKLATNRDELDIVAKNADEISAAGGYKVWKNASIPNLTPTDLAKLRGSQYSHTLERHGFEVSDDLLKRRATEGIAPDGSSIAKKQGNQRIGNVIPPMSSKFKDAASMKKALNAVDENTVAFQNALAAKQASTGAELPPRFSFQVELDEVVGYGFKKPEGTPNYVLTGHTLPGEPILVNGLKKIEVRYSFDQTSGKYIINTMFPIQ
jgi:hypothetical protein